MKKLLFILSAVFVSVMAWAQNNDEAPYLLNPYAYDLTSSWDESTQKLTINFKLNSAPNLHDTRDANNNAVNGRGIQVFLVDSKNNEYYICGPSQDDIRKAHGATSGRHGSYSYTIDLTSGLDRNGKLIPRNEDLTWKVRVNGRKNYNASIAHGIGTGTQNYSKPRYWPHASNPAYQQRLISHSVDVVTNPQAPNFGRIMITDGIKVSTDNGWGGAHTNTYYSYTEGRGLYILEPDFVNFANNGKRAALNSNKNGGFVDPLEPREVCVSDNGRIFVSSASKTSATAVWELSSNYKTWTEILTKSTLGNRCVVAMDTKGAGDAITLLLLCAPKDANTPLTCYEYNLQTQALTTISLPNNVTSCTPYVEGINFQAKVQYASNGDIWVGLGNDAGSRVVRVVDDLVRTYGSSYGGEAFVIKNNLMIKSSRTSGDADILFKRLDNGNNYFSENITGEGIGMDSWITDFAIDYADNVFVASNYHGRVIPISLPYDGVRSTPAPSQYKFKLIPATPNILATDLRFAPDGNSDRYVFSFNVNTTPQVAQIRFYKSYGDNGENDMKKNLAKINADNYSGGNDITPSFVYDIPTNQLKQGKISVSLGMCGGTIEDGKINNGKLPRGEWYWSVYVEAPRKSSVFAPIYRLIGQTHATEGYERKHATVNNYPETDGFGNIIVAHNPQNTTSDATRPEKGLRIYGISDSGNDEHTYTNTDRYSLRATYLNKNATTGMLNYPRRMDVAPDGKVYIADEGSPTNDKDWKIVSNGAVIHVRGGVKVWDPATPNKFTQFSDNKIFTATGVALWDGKLYATNTYDEYLKHLNGKINYTKEQQANTSEYGWNGFVGYVLNKYTSPGDWDSWSGNKTDYALGRGDASGNIAIVAMDKGVWMCQHKEHNRAVKDATYQPLADNLDGYILSFVPYGSNTRTWRSCVENGVDNYDTPGSRTERADASDFSQKKTSPVQSTPGGGIAYKKVNGKEYLYVVNHDGNIAQLEITSWSGSGTTATPTIPIENIKILTTPAATKSTKEASAGGYSTTWTGAYITSMTFDYAGNLVTTTGKNYHDGPQDIIVYTMPYDRKNAREIQAPNSCRRIPERVAQLGMDKDDLPNILIDHTQHEGCYVDLYRPLQAGMYNTICLPFSLTTLSGTPYQGADVREFASVEVKSIGGEDVLYLNFEPVDEMDAGIPYLIKPLNDIPAIVSFEQTLKFTKDQGDYQYYTYTPTGGSEQTITFQGVMVPTELEANPKHLFVVANNRLAESTGGTMLGFRAYFILSDVVRNIQPALSFKRPVATAVGNAYAEGIDIEKFIREGRIYIRLDDQVYDLTGARVQ